MFRGVLRGWGRGAGDKNAEIAEILNSGVVALKGCTWYLLRWLINTQDEFVEYQKRNDEK